MVITISHLGYIKRTPLSEFRAQHRGGVGSKGSETRDEDFIEHIYPATMHNTMMFFTQKGKCYWLKVYEIPEGNKTSKGRAIQNLLNIDSDDVVTAYLRVKNLNDTEFINSHYVLFCTKNGVIKKTLLEQYSRPRQNGVNAITIREDDRVIEVRMTNGNNEIVIANRNGRAIRFHESAVREMGRTATGVRGITLDEDGTDEVIGMICIKNPQEETIMVISIEVGFDGTFFQNRLTMGLTYYKTNTKNQFFSVAAPYESGLRNRYVNAGNVQNQGFEFSAGWYQQFNDNFSWSTDLNLSYNDNKIVELVDDLPNGLTLTDFGGAKIILKKDGSYGDLYVRHIMRDENGRPMKDETTGNPIVSGDTTEDMIYAGNMNAKFNAGWSNTFHYKDFTLSFLIDGKFGGKVLSMTEATLDGWGVSKRTGDARNAGKVVVDGVEFDPKAWYTTTGASNFNSPYANEFYVYDATNVRLRELSLGYTFRNLFGVGKNLTAAIIGRNLFFFYKDAPMDPDVSAGTGNGVQGVDMFALPTSRSFGLNLKLNF